MRILIGIVSVIFLTSFGMSEVTQYIYNRDGIHVSYAKEQGMLTSKYTSYWPNGYKKAEGEIRGNMRFGDWNLWDSTGKLVLARNYETGYVWTQLYPITNWPITSKTWLMKENKSYSMFFKITPDSVLRSARLWRFLPYNQYNPLFANNAVLDTLIACRDRGMLIAADDDEMIVPLNMAEFHQRLENSNPQHHIIGYRVKEDWWYDNTKQAGIFSIIAICPVLYAKNERDSVDLGWFHYNDVLRGKLATMYYMPTYQTGFPVGVEQTFFLRCFESDVYKYTNVQFKTIAQLFKDTENIAKEVQRMEIQPFEWEHDLWLEEFK